MVKLTDKRHWRIAIDGSENMFVTVALVRKSDSDSLTATFQ